MSKGQAPLNERRFTHSVPDWCQKFHFSVWNSYPAEGFPAERQVPGDEIPIPADSRLYQR
jgi:hypothetical protein